MEQLGAIKRRSTLNKKLTSNGVRMYVRSIVDSRRKRRTNPVEEEEEEEEVDKGEFAPDSYDMLILSELRYQCSLTRT